MACPANYVTEYCEPCRVRPPCANCDCVLEPVTFPEEFDGEQDPMYCAPIAASPVCCVDKPKKSFWQQLFGDRKCCICSKKKQDCVCKVKKKQKCRPEPGCIDTVECEPCPPRACRPSRPTCKCKPKPYSCPRRGCLPDRASVCGCHFYFNVENRPRRNGPVVKGFFGARSKINGKVNGYKYSNDSKNDGKLKTVEDDGYDRYNIHEEPVRDGRRRSSTADKRKDSCSPHDKQKYSNLVRRHSGSLLRERSSQDNIHIGVTFTKEETKYFKPNDCPTTFAEENGFDRKHLANENSSGNLEHILSLEIHNNSDEMDKNSNKAEGLKDYSSSLVDDFLLHRNEPKSESLSRELLPLMKRRKNTAEFNSLINEVGKMDNQISWEGKKHQVRPSVNDNSQSPNRNARLSLDRRVSEILRKLLTIEEKINVIEKKGMENKDIRIDFDGQKSTVSFHFKDNGRDRLNEKNDTSGNSARSKADAVIEIRQTRSRTCSPVRDTSSRESVLHTSQSLDRTNNTKKPNNPKIIIKIPKSKNNCFTLPNEDDYQQLNIDSKAVWSKVSNDLKFNSPTTCYCYKCMCKRNSRVQ